MLMRDQAPVIFFCFCICFFSICLYVVQIKTNKPFWSAQWPENANFRNSMFLTQLKTKLIAISWNSFLSGIYSKKIGSHEKKCRFRAASNPSISTWRRSSKILSPWFKYFQRCDHSKKSVNKILIKMMKPDKSWF